MVSSQAFLIIIFVGVASSFLILPPNRVIRSDGTIVKLEAASKPHEEVIGLLRLFKDWRMLGKYHTSGCTSPTSTPFPRCDPPIFYFVLPGYRTHTPMLTRLLLCSARAHVLRFQLLLRLPRRSQRRCLRRPHACAQCHPRGRRRHRRCADDRVPRARPEVPRPAHAWLLRPRRRRSPLHHRLGRRALLAGHLRPLGRLGAQQGPHPLHQLPRLQLQGQGRALLLLCVPRSPLMLPAHAD